MNNQRKELLNKCIEVYISEDIKGAAEFPFDIGGDENSCILRIEKVIPDIDRSNFYGLSTDPYFDIWFTYGYNFDLEDIKIFANNHSLAEDQDVKNAKKI